MTKLVKGVNSPGGKIVVLIFLVCLGLAAMKFHLDGAAGIVGGASALLWQWLKKGDGNDGASI